MSRLVVLKGLVAAHYRPHGLHAESQVWPEKNCYVDIWIELLHTLGLEPRAVMAFTLAVDFEGDQWTFFKPPHGEIHALYGIDVQELNVWRPLLDHAVEHLAAGRLLSTESDAFWLPDTAGTDYRRQHTKTTIVLNDLDLEAQALGYFHNAGYHRLEGEDFRRLFRIGVDPDPGFLPLYAELIRSDRVVRRRADALGSIALDLLREHGARRPASNPMPRFGERLGQELPTLPAQGLPHYHAWAFATVRQFGAAFELAAAHLRWHAGLGRADLLPAAECFDRIAQGGKALILKLARTVNTGRPADLAPLLGDMASAWDDGMAALDRALGA
ncbi:DUF1839 family protein [uncultured Methylibium sp.]|uniref:DUF1839 family protein n=1 Tax=uncultured Methylibium sp. TaxID=381093 RepID=UPI0025FF03FD|nr:DUF1839 family protein [uncultured Methylibium sp.]